MTFADLKRKPVVSMADGAKIGEVDDLVIDTAQWAVRDLYIATKTGRGVLPLGNLKNIGPDAVTVESSSAADWNAKAEGLCFAEMKKLSVVDGTGTMIGHIAEVVYEVNGAIESFEVQKGGVLGLGVQITKVCPGEIRGLGEKLITVDVTPAPTA